MAVNLIAWWSALVLLGLAFSPVTERIFPASFPDHGRAFAKPLALVGLTYLAWLLTSAGVPHGAALGLSVAGLAAAGACMAWRGRSAVHDDPGASPSSAARGWLRDEALFLAALLSFAALRALQPAIFGAEKYMDFALFNTLVRARGFPPQDPWMSGVPVNYYYFGYLMFADLARLTRVPPEVAYNLSLATVGAVVTVAAASLGRLFASRPWGGALAVAAAVGIGNLDGARQLWIERRGLSSFDYWRSTRVVPHTINEFPFFSLLHGDLHPHVTALVIDVALIGVAVGVSQTWGEARQSRPRAVALGLSALGVLLGALALANPWDVPVYFALLGTLALHRLWDVRRPISTVLGVGGFLIVAALLTMLLSLPFGLQFHAQFHGFGMVHERTGLIPFFTVFGFLLLLPAWRLVEEIAGELRGDPPARDLVFATAAFAAVALYVATRSGVLIFAAAFVLGSLLVLLGPERGRPSTPAAALLLVAGLAIGAGETLFLRDPYGAELQRMNTIFKLYFQAWLMLALALPGATRDLIDRLPRTDRPLVVLCLVFGLAASLCYPVAAIYTRWPGNGRAFSLDGLAYLRREHPSDAAAIEWLRHRASGRPVVLEATGKPYSYFARVSSNTGLPTVLGWANHETVWRGSDPRIAERARDVDRMYGDADLDRVRSLLRRYRVRWIFVGELERGQYPAAALAKFGSHPELFAPLYRSGSTEVFRVLDTATRE